MDVMLSEASQNDPRGKRVGLSKQVLAVVSVFEGGVVGSSWSFIEVGKDGRAQNGISSSEQCIGRASLLLQIWF